VSVVFLEDTMVSCPSHSPPFTQSSKRISSISVSAPPPWLTLALLSGLLHFYHTALGLQATANRGGLDVVFIRGGEGGKCESWDQIVTVVHGNWQYDSVVDYIPG
jgi:hypothetical protein